MSHRSDSNHPIHVIAALWQLHQQRVAEGQSASTLVFFILLAINAITHDIEQAVRDHLSDNEQSFKQRIKFSIVKFLAINSVHTNSRSQSVVDSDNSVPLLHSLLSSAQLGKNDLPTTATFDPLLQEAPFDSAPLPQGALCMLGRRQGDFTMCTDSLPAVGKSKQLVVSKAVSSAGFDKKLAQLKTELKELEKGYQQEKKALDKLNEKATKLTKAKGTLEAQILKKSDAEGETTATKGRVAQVVQRVVGARLQIGERKKPLNRQFRKLTKQCQQQGGQRAEIHRRSNDIERLKLSIQNARGQVIEWSLRHEPRLFSDLTTDFLNGVAPEKALAQFFQRRILPIFTASSAESSCSPQELNVANAFCVLYSQVLIQDLGADAPNFNFANQRQELQQILLKRLLRHAGLDHKKATNTLSELDQQANSVEDITRITGINNVEEAHRLHLLNEMQKSFVQLPQLFNQRNFTAVHTCIDRINTLFEANADRLKKQGWLEAIWTRIKWSLMSLVYWMQGKKYGEYKTVLQRDIDVATQGFYKLEEATTSILQQSVVKSEPSSSTSRPTIAFGGKFWGTSAAVLTGMETAIERPSSYCYDDDEKTPNPSQQSAPTPG